MSDEAHTDAVNFWFCRVVLTIAGVTYILAGGLG